MISCRECGAPARRVPEVIDAWYDSGSMPFARHGAPLRNEEEFERSYPAQFICEAIDQTRGWFYSLMAVGTLVFGRSAYENVVCLGLVVDEAGRKMSKHLGNVLEPIPLMEAHGADAVRWFFAAAGSPWSTRRIGAGALDEIVRKVLLTYWNTVSFLVLYANAAAAQGRAWGPGNMADAPPPADRPLLDRWVLSELHAVTADVTDALEGFDTAAAGRRLGAFIDDVSNWYVRRSRRRFWEGPATPDSAAAFATLYECLETLTRLMAPIAPFLTDYVWGVLRPTGGPDSVHLADWPQADQGLIDRQLSAADGAHPAAGGTRPVGPGRRVGADPAAAPPGARGRPGLRRPRTRTARRDSHRAQRAVPGHADHGRGRPGGSRRQAELPCPRPPVRQADPGRGGRALRS